MLNICLPQLPKVFYVSYHCIIYLYQQQMTGWNYKYLHILTFWIFFTWKEWMYIWDISLRKNNKTKTYHLLAEYFYTSSNRSVWDLIEIWDFLLKPWKKQWIFVEKLKSHVFFFFFYWSVMFWSFNYKDDVFFCR